MCSARNYIKFIQTDNAQIAAIEKKYFSTIKINELLDSNNIEKFERIKSEKRKIEFILVRYLLKELSHSIQINYKENGEPTVENNQCISISHCENLVVVGLSKNKIGIDSETIQEKILKIQHKFIHESEFVGQEFSPLELTIRWCCKEALFKLSELKTFNIKENLRVKQISENHYEGLIIDENKIIKLEIHQLNNTIVCTTM
jgi:phosphopantetheinyl transferase